MTHAPLIHDGELVVLNAAQTILVRLSGAAKARGYEVMTGARDYTSADALDYGQAAALASHATDAIFDLLNVCDSHKIQQIPYRNLHNREKATDPEAALTDESYDLAETVA